MLVGLVFLNTILTSDHDRPEALLISAQGSRKLFIGGAGATDVLSDLASQNLGTD